MSADFVEEPRQGSVPYDPDRKAGGGPAVEDLIDLRPHLDLIA